MKKKISIIICCYNEEDSIVATIHSIQSVFENCCKEYVYDIIIVDDGSSDKTLPIVKEMGRNNPSIFYIELSRNFGKDAALFAGITKASGDAVVMLDADLQHPPELIPDMINLWNTGYDVVYAYREKTNKHVGIVNRVFSSLFYATVNYLSDIRLEDGISDFRLIDKKVVDSLRQLNENYLFFRGLINWVGFRQKGIPYTPNPRFGGETKYSKRALLNLAIQGITSFSVKPLYLALYLGFSIAGLSLLYIPYAIYSLIYGYAISGWASLIVTIAFLGGLQLSIMGIIGLYLGKLFMQAKQRPNYIVRQTNI